MPAEANPQRRPKSAATRTAADVPGVAVRLAAAHLLAAIIDEGASLRSVLPAALEGLPDSRDRAFLEATVFAALRFKPRLEARVNALLEKPLPRSARLIERLLLAAAAQLVVLGQPRYAVANASVAASRLLKPARLDGLVNALLRRLDATPLADESPPGNLADDPVRQLAWRHAHPRWLVAALLQDAQLNLGEVERILVANNTPGPMWLRVNARKSSRMAAVEQLAAAGLRPTTPDDETLGAAIELRDRSSVERLPGFAEGLLSVQDAAAQRVFVALAVQPGQVVLDACAAPGGKAAHCAESEPALAKLIAIEVDPTRARRMAKAFERLDVGRFITIEICDARDFAARSLPGSVDRIVIDAPCSATGIIRRQPDIKWHRRASDLPPLIALQDSLLEALWPLVKPGGRLVYCTCSVLEAENSLRIRRFCERTPDAAIVDPGAAFGSACNPGRQRWPGDGDEDGFYYAILEKS